MLFYYHSLDLDERETLKIDELANRLDDELRALHRQYDNQLELVPLLIEPEELRFAACCSVELQRRIGIANLIDTVIKRCGLWSRQRTLEEMYPKEFRDLLQEERPPICVSLLHGYSEPGWLTSRVESMAARQSSLDILKAARFGFLHGLEFDHWERCREDGALACLLVGQLPHSRVQIAEEIVRTSYMKNRLPSKKVVTIWTADETEEDLTLNEVENCFQLACGGAVVFSDFTHALGCRAGWRKVDLEKWSWDTADAYRRLIAVHPDVMTVLCLPEADTELAVRVRRDILPGREEIVSHVSLIHPL